MAGNRSDSYHDLESAQAGRALLKRDQKRWYWIVFAIASFLVMMMYSTKDVNKTMFFAPLGSAAFNSSEFHYNTYFYLSAIILFILYGVMMPSSYSQKIRDKRVVLHKKGSLGAMDEFELKITKWLDQTFYFGLYPISGLLLSGVPQEDREKIYFRWGWHSHVEKEFFKQEFREVDGYKRVKHLSLLDGYERLFTRQDGDKVKLSKEYKFVVWLFKSEGELHDLMRISEGFIAGDEERLKYDKLLSSQEFEERLKRVGSIDKMRMFNGTNEVAFSIDLMKRIIDDEAKRFELFVRTYAFDSKMLFTRRFRKYEAALKKDMHLKKYLFPKHLRDEQFEAIVNDQDKFRNHLIFAIICYFRLMLFKMIIGQYVNLPAGVMVVKIRDYTARMITEIFEDHCLVNVIQDKNDGSNGEFESDNLANLFLASVNHYRVSSMESFENRILKIYNFIPTAKEETSDKMASDIASALSEDWIAQMAESIGKEG